MAKKYLSLDEAAQMLSLAPEELVRLRERGDVRGFADRGTWKFKNEDIELLLRRRQADSNPEVPLMSPPPPPPRPEVPSSASMPVSQISDPDMGEQPTVIRREQPHGDHANLLSDDDETLSLDSDSDVRLVNGPDLDLEFDTDSDSDVKLVGLGGAIANNVGTDPEIVIPKPDSDSDVRLIRPDSDSDVKLSKDGSDSDVKLVSGGSDSDVKIDDKKSDSDVQLIGEETERELRLTPQDKGEGGTDTNVPQVSRKPALNQSDSDIKLIADDDDEGELVLKGKVEEAEDVTLMDDDDDPIAIDFTPDNGHQTSVLDDESGISLGRDSSLLLGESGISLGDPNDSGIALDLSDDDDALSLALDEDSGITLDAGESGISLDAGDSGISLEASESGISLEDDNHGGTVPMMDIFADEDDAVETQFEVPTLDESGYDMMADDATGPMEIPTEDEVFDLDEDEAGDEVYAEDDMDLDADEYEEDLDVFDADEGAFEDAGTEAYVGGGGRMAMADTEWDTATFVGLSIGSVLLLVCGLVMIDLVKNTATAAAPNPVSGQIIEILGGLYK